MSKELVQDVLKAIKSAAKTTGKEPYNVIKADLLAEGLTDWNLRQVGGLQAVLKKYYPVEGKALDVIADNKAAASYIAKLEKQLGDKQSFEKTVLEAITNGLKPLPPIKLKNPKKQKTKIKRELVMEINDCHFGLIVDPDEVNGLNKFGWQEASRRTAMVLRETIDFKPHTRGEVEKVHLVLNGDIICGLIHGQNTNGIDLYIHQINGALHILTYVVSHLLANFKEVEVHGISGNHCDAIHKRAGGNRVTTEKFDSYTNGIFFGLSTAFRDNKRVSFNFPKTPYAFMDLPAGRAMIIHGDSMFATALGNPGTSINVKSISEALRKFNSGEVSKGRKPIKLALFAHTHTHAHFITSDDIEVYVAPSLSGTDGFAHGLNINTSFTGQVVFESVKDIILADHRLIRVNKADSDSSLDQLIPTYKYKMVWEK